MKKKVFLICLSLSVVFLMSSCSKDKVLKPDTPVNTSILLTNSISTENYEVFNDLFSEGRKNYVSKEDFQKLVDIQKTSKGSSGCTLFEVITLDNGEMFLIRLTPFEIDGEYQIEDVTIIPDEMKDFFLTKDGN